MLRTFVSLLVVMAALPAAAVAAQRPASPAAPAPAVAQELPPSRWAVKQGAPPAVAVVLERMKRQRRREFDAQVRVIEQAERDLAAHKAGRVVRQLRAPEGWRAVPARAVGAREYAFQTPQIKGREVVKAEAVLEHAKRRLAEIRHPDYLAKPVLRVAELEEGVAGTVSLRILHQVSGTDAVVRVEDDPPVQLAGLKAVGAPPHSDVYLSDFPARDYRPGMLLRDWTIEVVGTKTFQGDNGRTRKAPHAEPLEWRKWVEIERTADGR